MSHNRKYQWKKIKRGDPLPEGAVQAGRTATDGAVFVALNEDGDCGKLNLDLVSGMAHLIYCATGEHPVEEGYVLVNTSGSVVAWRAISSGHRLPEEVVFAGERFGDGRGPVYVARSGNECGMLLLDGDVVKHIQCHHKGVETHGEVLLFDPCLLVSQSAQPGVDAQPKENWKAKWMWNDAGLSPTVVPGPLRSLARKGAQLNPVRWSAWQDLPSTVRDLDSYQRTQHSTRPVRIETSAGICEVYESAHDLALTLNKTLTGETAPRAEISTWLS